MAIRKAFTKQEGFTKQAVDLATEAKPELITPLKDNVIIGWLNVTKVIHDTQPIRARDNGQSIGEMVDDYIRACAENREEIQNLEIQITPEHWQQIAAGYAPAV